MLESRIDSKSESEGVMQGRARVIHEMALRPLLSARGASCPDGWDEAVVVRRSSVRVSS